MANRQGRTLFTSTFLANHLEPRNLPSAGLVGVANVVRELGPVSPAAALAGVAATATIDAGSSVTFRFEIEAGGAYTLLVRHTGAGLTLQAQGPIGSATIDPGPAGSFQTVALRLPAGTYAVTAAAKGGQSSFVDWELLLDNGVGQTTATAVTSFVPSASLTTTMSSGIASNPGNTAAATAPVAATASTSSEFWAQGQPTPAYIASTPVGRMTLDAAMLPAATLGPAAAGALAARPGTDLDAALVIALQPEVAFLPSATPAPVALPSLDSFAEDATRELSLAGRAENLPAGLPTARLAATTGSVDPAGEQISLTAISPGLLIGAVVVTVASKRRLKGHHPLLTQGMATPAGTQVGRSMQKLRAFFERSYRPGRCEPIRPIRRRDGRQAD